MQSELDVLLDLHRRYVPTLKRFTEGVEDYQRRMSALCKKLAPTDMEIYANIAAGHLTANWTPHLAIHEYRAGNARFTKFDDGKWYWTSISDTSYFYKHRCLNMPPPTAFSGLDTLIKKLEETGLPVKIHTNKFRLAHEVEHPLNADDVKLLHPEGTNIKVGQIWHMGWDIPDIYVSVVDTNGEHIYYSHDAHGGAMTHHIFPGESREELNKFLEGKVFDTKDFA